MRPSNANDKATVAINCNKNKSDAAAHGRRPDLEARRLLGVEAQDAGLRCGAAAATGRPRRALALLESAAARPSRRRGPLRRVGLIARHRFGILATFYATAMRVAQAECESQRHAMQASGTMHASRPGARRLQGALQPGTDAVDCKETHIAEALTDFGCSSGEADTRSSCEPFTQRHLSRTGVATRPIGLCSAPSKPAAREVDKQ